MVVIMAVRVFVILLLVVFDVALLLPETSFSRRFERGPFSSSSSVRNFWLRRTLR